MKKYLLLGILISTAISFNPVPVSAQQFELQQLMLNIEKLNQFRQILNQMYDGYKILSDGYNKVKDITSGNFKLHQVFLDGLYMVNPSIKKYQRVADIISCQVNIVKEYKAAYNNFSFSKVFSQEQLDYLSEVYKRVLDGSLQNLEELTMIITAGKLRMSDDERITTIDRIYEDMQQKLLFLRNFNNQQAGVAIEKLRDKSELQTLHDLYGIE